MDDVDDERFSRAILSGVPAARPVRGRPAAAAAPGERRLEGRREEVLLGPTDAPRAVRVRGLDADERERLQREAQLLATLEVAGIGAAPTVLELEDEGYVRETAPPLRHREGRRSAGAGSPPTGERHALAQARQELEELLEALHERGWVLGAESGDGLGVRADGSVLPLDLRGLRPEESLSARRHDRHWVDTVLQDQDRTLRRRVHLERLRREEEALPPVEALASPPLSQEALLPVEALPGTLPEEEHAPQPPVPRPEEEHAPQRPLPPPRRSRRTPGGEAGSSADPSAAGSDGTTATSSTARSGLLSVLGDVLRRPRLRRIAALSGAAVLLCGALLGLGAWWMNSSGSMSTAADRPAEPTLTDASAHPAPRIEDPRILVAELAGQRHAFVTGLSDRPVSAPGSEALAEDQRIRDAYRSVTVTAGGPVVHSAEVLEQTGPDGQAVLGAVTSMEELRLEDPDGVRTVMPATDPVEVRLEVQWTGTGWEILRVEEG